MVEWSMITAVQLTADIGRNPHLAAILHDALGAPLPGAGQASGVSPRILWQGPNDWLLLCTDADATVAALAPLGSLLATPVALAAFDLDAGALASGTAVRPGDAMACVTRFAQVRATVLGDAGRYRLFIALPVARHVALFLAGMH